MLRFFSKSELYDNTDISDEFIQSFQALSEAAQKAILEKNDNLRQKYCEIADNREVE